jgi:hypothetical protein
MIVPFIVVTPLMPVEQSSEGQSKALALCLGSYIAHCRSSQKELRERMLLGIVK